MKNKILLLDIGNTHTRTAFYENGAIGDIVTLKTRLLDAALLPDDCPIAAACVVPEVRERLIGRDIYFIDYCSAKDVDFGQVDAVRIGADRVANAIALRDKFGSGVVVDFGSAITLEAVSEEGVFLGGAIAPGRSLMRRSLHEFTGLLPLAELQDCLPSDLGKDTIEAITFGIDLGIDGMVRAWLAAAEKRYGKFKNIIGVGGDAKLWLENIHGMLFGGEDFTFAGILKGFMDK